VLNPFPQYTKTRGGLAEIAVPTRRFSKGNYVKKLGSFIKLPSFDVNATWRGASEIVLTFRYFADFNTIFKNFTKPSPNPNYCPCISYKPTSETIVRYKLWKDVGEILYVPLYNGEFIGSSFTIEIWNTPATEVSGGGEIFYMSKMFLPTICDDADIELDLDVIQCTDLIFDYTNYAPAAGDYYIVSFTDLACPVVTLIKATVFGDHFTLQSTDGTWHNVYIYRDSFGVVTIGIEQTDTAPGDKPYIPFLIDGIVHKLNLQYDSINGIHTYSLYDTVVDPDALVAYLITDPNTGLEHFVRGNSDLSLEFGQVDL
jgi:hypothetical protein